MFDSLSLMGRQFRIQAMEAALSNLEARYIAQLAAESASFSCLTGGKAATSLTLAIVP